MFWLILDFFAKIFLPVTCYLLPVTCFYMLWFWYAFGATALFSLANHIDKFLVGKRGGGIGSLLIVSSCIDLLFIPLIAFFTPHVFDIKPSLAVMIACSNAVMLIGFIVYLYALERDEASVVAPLFQVIPIFSFLLAFFILGERLTLAQITGSFFVITGAIILSCDVSHTKTRVKYDILLLMLIASFLIALSTVVFKKGMLETDFWKAAFWGYFGDVFIGFCGFIFLKKYRNEFFAMLRSSKIVSIGFNTFDEVVNITGTLFFKYATLLAPVALVSSVGAFAPFLIYCFGMFFSRFFPFFSHDHFDKKNFFKKIISISILCIGGYLLV